MSDGRGTEKGRRERKREREKERARERARGKDRVGTGHSAASSRSMRTYSCTCTHRAHIIPYTHAIHFLICSLSPTIYLPPPLKPPFNPPSRCPPPPPPLARYKIHNCDVLFREDCDDVQLIDVIEGNRKYIKVVYVYNKIDQICLEDVDRLARKPNSVVIGVHMGLNLE